MKTFRTDIRETKFAPAEREGKSIVFSQKNKLLGSLFLDQIFSKVPLMFLILNTKRQIVYANELFIKSIGYGSLDDVLGYRMGEIFHCINAEKEEGGCGTSKGCKYCGAILALLESDENNALVTKEKNMLSQVGVDFIANEFEVSSKPFFWKEEKFFLITLKDIGDQKRREQMERVFYHDLLNKAGSIEGLTNLIEIERLNESKSLIGIIKRGMKELLNDIQYQRAFSLAEKGQLSVNRKKINTKDLLENLKNDFISYIKERNIELVVDKNSNEVIFYSDSILVNRILTNLIKNAFEASQEKDKITIGSNLENGNVVLWVNNPKVMPREIQMQIFQRSFSTKGTGRGIGTYSIKIFTEKYLDGKVDFKSEIDEGTTFYIKFPMPYDIN